MKGQKMTAKKKMTKEMFIKEIVELFGESENQKTTKKKTTKKKVVNKKDCYALKIHEVVQIMGICERTVRAMIAANELPHFRVGRAIRIPWQPLKEWMDSGGTGGGYWVSADQERWDNIPQNERKMK